MRYLKNLFFQSVLFLIIGFSALTSRSAFAVGGLSIADLLNLEPSHSVLNPVCFPETVMLQAPVPATIEDGNRIVNDSRTRANRATKVPCDYPGCKKEISKRNLLRHKRNLHGIDRISYSSPQIEQDQDRFFKCEELGCDKTYATEIQLNRHLKAIHNKEVVYECAVEGCEKSFESLDELEKHEIGHSMIQLYPCNEVGCNQTFQSSKSLKRHQKNIHNVCLPYKCNWEGCDHRFLYVGELKVHSFVHTGVGIYSCAYPNCNRSFQAKNLLESHHKRIHLGEEPFRCDIANCKKSYSNLSNLNRHKKVDHGGSHF